MDWAQHEELSKVWQAATRLYVEQVDKFFRRIANYGPEKAGREPQDPREGLGDAVLEVVREANESGHATKLREHFAPAHRPFLDAIEAKSQWIHKLVAIDEERCVATVGEPWQVEAVYLLEPESATRLPGAVAVGRNHARSHFVVAYENRVDVHEGWMGPLVGSWPVPRGNEGIAPTVEAPAAENVYLFGLTLFPDASAALLCTPEGVFKTSSQGVERLFPSREGMREAIEGALEDGETELAFHFDMIHAAVHPRGELIAVGAQSSQHELVDPLGHRVAQFGPVGSEYPHHASFDEAGGRALFNACHMYNGQSVVGDVDALRGLDIDPYEEHEALRVIDSMCRVYASAWRRETAILGDAWGYLRARAPDGSEPWRHHLGSTVFSMDTSPSGDRLFVGTAAGFVHVIELETGARDPFIIQTGTNREVRRYVCWKDEEVWLW